MPATRLDLALRVYAEPVGAKAGGSTGRPPPLDPVSRPRHVLVLDAETTTDPTQRLTFGWYRYARITWRGNQPTIWVVEEGIVHADDLATTDPEGFAAVEAFARSTPADVEPGQDPRIRPLGLAAFLDDVFYPAACRAEATVVGFNLPFDVARLACDVGEAHSHSLGDRKRRPDRRFAGGFSLVLWRHRLPDGTFGEHRYRPRIAVKHLDSKRSLIGLTRTVDAERSHRGQFLDARALAFALTDKGHSLASAGEAFGLASPKLKAPPHGRISPAYIAYARRDVEATTELFGRLAEEYLRHPIERQMTKVFSPASIGKGYLRIMGLRPVLERQPDFPREVLGIGMLSYFGGRAECHVRRLAVPVRYLDFRSMYPTVNALMGLWELLTAEQIEAVDATEEVRLLLDGATPERVLDPTFWRSLVGFVRIVPSGNVLPVRAPYDAGPATQIGVNRLTADEPLWFTLPDAVAAALLGGRPPTVVSAIRLVSRGRQDGLRSVALRGAIPIDPRTDDFFRRVVEERVRVLAGEDPSPVERDRLARFLKVLANASSYGIYAEVNRQAGDGTTTRVRVEGLDGPFEISVARPELSGEFYFGPLASVITGAARLMLGLLEHLVTDVGGTWAFADTDSMAIVASETGAALPGLPRRVLAWSEVEGIRRRFEALNPYERDAVPGSVLKLEEANLDAGAERELWCLAISAKRYALFTIDAEGQPVLVKWSEHGLGHLLNPIDPEADDRDWIREVWEGLVREALGLPVREPAWLDRAAVGRITVSSPALLRPFAALNSGKLYADQIKPFNFLLTAHVRPFGHPTGVDPTRFQLIAPYTSDARQWTKLAWIDRYTGQRYRIATTGDTGGDGIARVRTYGDVIAEYRVHPEAKSAAPDGEPCGAATVGLLGRRDIVARRIRYIGKESNALEEVDADLIHNADEVSTEYVDARRDAWCAEVLPRLHEASTADVARALGVNVSTVKRWKTGPMRPHPRQLAALRAWMRTDEPQRESEEAARARPATSRGGRPPASQRAGPSPDSRRAGATSGRPSRRPPGAPDRGRH